LKYDGVFQDQAQLEAGPRSSANDKLGDARFVDKNGDGKINYTDDRMIVGIQIPILSMAGPITFLLKDLTSRYTCRIVW
jgi:hypothetical protein